MKRTIYPILAFIVILVIACNNPKKDVKENPLQGAWEMIYSKYIYPDTIIETTKFTNPTVKLLTKKHYAFGRQAGENKITGEVENMHMKGIPSQVILNTILLQLR